MKIIQYLYLTLFCFVASIVTLQCEGIDILYPKSNSIIQSEASTYLIIGNTNDRTKKLLQVSLLHINSKTNEQVSKEVWTGNDELLKVSAIQQELNKFDFDLPNDFWFKILLEQDGKQCEYESDKFQIN